VNYDPKKVALIVAGIPITGFSPESMIKAARRTDKNSLVIGCDGSGTFVESADDSGEVTISLQHTSPSNSFLAGLYKSKKEFPFAAVDLNSVGGDFGASGTRCKIKTMPDFERGKDATINEWVLLVQDLNQAFDMIDPT
jgi:hypothetical protein